MKSALVVTVMGLSLVSRAFAAGEKATNAQELVKLQTRVAQAGPQDRCLLYAELIQGSTDLAIVQMRAGDEMQALATVESIETYASRLDLSHVKSTKKLKAAEILLEQSAFRLKELLMGASFEDRSPLERALKQVNTAESELLLKVFER